MKRVKDYETKGQNREGTMDKRTKEQRTNDSRAKGPKD